MHLVRIDIIYRWRANEKSDILLFIFKRWALKFHFGKGGLMALDGGTRPRATTPTHTHFLSSMGDGQANAFRWRDTPRATLSVVLCITYNFDLIIDNDYYKFHNCYHKLHNCIIYNI